MFRKINLLLIIMILNLPLLPAIAAEGDEHAGDIQTWRIGAEIFVSAPLVESDFGDLGGGAFATDEPGFNVNIAQGTFTPGNWLRFKPVGQLLYWDGTQWISTIPNGERIEVTDALESTLAFSNTGVSETAGTIGEIGSDGGVHEHLSFKILDASNTPNGTPGAYRIQFKLFESIPNSNTSASIATSPIAIVFNRGLEQEDFERAVSAASDLIDNSVFVAETGILTIQEVKALGAYYKVKLQHIGDYKFQLIEVNEIPKSE